MSRSNVPLPYACAKIERLALGTLLRLAEPRSERKGVPDRSASFRRIWKIFCTEPEIWAQGGQGNRDSSQGLVKAGENEVNMLMNKELQCFSVKTSQGWSSHFVEAAGDGDSVKLRLGLEKGVFPKITVATGLGFVRFLSPLRCRKDGAAGETVLNSLRSGSVGGHNNIKNNPVFRGMVRRLADL